LRALGDPAPGDHFTTAGTRPLGRILTVDPVQHVVARGRWLAPLLSVGDLVMARRQLLNLKRLAEQSTAQPRV